MELTKLYWRFNWLSQKICNTSRDISLAFCLFTQRKSSKQGWSEILKNIRLYCPKLFNHSTLSNDQISAELYFYQSIITFHSGDFLLGTMKNNLQMDHKCWDSVLSEALNFMKEMLIFIFQLSFKTSLMQPVLPRAQNLIQHL